MKRALYSALVLVAASLAQTDAPLKREGRTWVQTAAGKLPAGGQMLRIICRGSISVRGEARQDIEYKLSKKANVRSHAQARAALAKVALRPKKVGGWTVLDVESGPQTWADVELRVPRRLRGLSLESDYGSVEAVDIRASVKADTGVGAVNIDRVSGDVTIRTGGGAIRLGRIEGSVKCFSGAGTIMADWIGGEADLNTGGGQIHVISAKGPILAAAHGGNIRVERSELGVTANANSGLIDLLGVEGPVIAETGNGSIKVRSAGNITVQSGSGAIRLYSVYGGLRASTGVGSIVAELAPGKPLKDSALTTGMGDITVYIPSNLAVTVQATNTSPGSQRIISDFTEIRAALAGGQRQLAQGEINGGGPLLKVAAAGGTIYLRRKD